MSVYVVSQYLSLYFPWKKKEKNGHTQHTLAITTGLTPLIFNTMKTKSSNRQRAKDVLVFKAILKGVEELKQHKQWF